MRRWAPTIQAKLASLFLLLALLPMAVIAVLAMSRSQEALKRRIGAQLEEAAFHTVDKIDRMLFEGRENLKAWAISESMQDVTAADPQGRIADTLSKLKRSYGVYAGLFCVNREGTIVAASETPAIGQDVSDAPWFQEAIRRADVSITDLVYFKFIEGFAVGFTVPIVATPEQTRPVGWLSSRLNWSELFDITSSIRVNEEGQSASGYAVLINREGFLLSGPGFLLAEEEEEEREGLRFSHTNFVTDGFNTARSALQGQRGFTVETGPDGRTWLIGYAGSQGYRDFPGLGWAVLVVQETAEAFAPVQALRNQFVGVSGVVACVVLILAWAVSRSISQPIRALAAFAQAIGRGDLSRTVHIRSRGELGQLAMAFNKMVGDLAESQQKVAAHTQALERSNKELDDFTYIVSHDLKEPLRSIDAFSKFVVEGAASQLDADGRMYLERVRANAKRMQELIEDLLEVSRLSRRPNELQPVDIARLIEDIKLRFEHLMQEKRVQLVVDPALPTLTVDPVRLGEVFANLISNAIKYNEKPIPTIEIGGKAVDGWYEFFVKDNGPGIAPEYHEKIFEIFQRLGKKEEQEGTGVGLTIVKKIVELHKGRVWVDSALGQGTTMYFTIPTDEAVLRGKKKLGEILVAKGLINEQAVQDALKEQAGGAHGGTRGAGQNPARGG